MNFNGEIINNRYEIKELLGEGGTSFVYKVQNLDDDSFYAAKFMKDKITTRHIEEIIRFKREVDVVSKLDHNNIIKIYESGDYKSTPYIVTELLEGQSLQSYVKMGLRMPVEKTLTIVSQLAEALAYVHSKSIIHRDLKPGNVFLLNNNEKSTVKLLDFGVSYVLELGEINSEDQVVGTFGYMSPEATGMLNRRVDERSDLYSLGVIFYTLLAGTPPFKGKEVNKILHQQVAIEPVQLYKIRSDITYSLNEVVMKLMMKDPDLRYQSATGFLHDIERILKGSFDFVPGDKDTKIRLSYKTRILGRDEELKKAGKIIEDVSTCQSKLLFISGEAGVGKTGFVDEMSRIIFEKRGLFLKSRALDQSNKVPYQLFRNLLDEYLRYVEKLNALEKEQEIERLKGIGGKLGELLIDLNPTIGKYLANWAKITPLEDKSRESQRHLMLLSEFFLKLPKPGGITVFFLDDLHWADEGSLNLLKEMFNTMDREKLLILGTFRDNELTKDHGLNLVLKNCENKEGFCEKIKLSLLDTDSIKKLVSNLLGEKEENITELADFIKNKTRGNPLFAINLLRELVEKGAVCRQEGFWKIDGNILGEIQVSSSVLEIILKRIDSLNEQQVNLLCMAAIIGRDVNLQVLHDLSDMVINKFVEVIDGFVDIQILERVKDKGRVIFAHDRIRDVFLKKIQSVERKAIHLQIARILENRNIGKIEDVLFDLAHHYIEGKDEQKTLQYVIPAAHKAKESYANEEALRYYEIVMRILEGQKVTNRSLWIDISLNLVDIYLTVGNIQKAIEILDMTLPFIPEKINKARVLRKIGVAYFKQGDWKKCEENVARSLDILNEKLPNSDLKWNIRLVTEFVKRGIHRILFKGTEKKENNVFKVEDIEILRSYIALNWMFIFTDKKKFMATVLRMLNLSEVRLMGSEEMGISCAGYASALMSIPIFELSYKYHMKAIKIRKTIGDWYGEAQSLQLMGFYLSWRGQHYKSIESFKRSRDTFSKIGDMWELGMVYSGLGYGYRYTSRYKKSIEYNSRYFDISQKTENTYGVISGHIELAFCFVESGSFENAENHVLKALKLCEEYKDKYLYCCTLIIKGYLELERDNFDVALQYLQEARKIEESNSLIKDYTVNVYPYLAEAFFKKLQKEGKVSKAQYKVLYGFCKDALRKTRLWVNHYGSALRAISGYYLLKGNVGKAKKYMLKSIEYTEKFDRKYETAKGYYGLGIISNISSHFIQAKDYFKKAVEIFNSIEAHEYLNKCIPYYTCDEQNDMDFSNTMTKINVDRKLSTILNTGRFLSSILDIDELLEKIMDSVLEHVGAQRGALFLYPEEKKGELQPVVVRNVSKEEIRGHGFSGSRSVIKKVESEKLSIIVSDALMDESLNTESSVIINKIRSVMCSPIMSKGEMIGVIYLDNSLLGGLFTKDDIKILDLIACQAGVSVENARLYKRLQIYSKEIENSRDEIKMWNTTLEKRVSQRTRELEIMNNKYKSVARELNVKNKELEEMVEKLKEHAEMVEELAITKERNRFAMDVHDTLGHSMVLLIKLLEVCKMEMKNGRVCGDERLDDAISTAREGMKELKRSIYGLVPEKLEVNKFIIALKKLAEDFKMSGVEIKINVEGIYDYRNPAYSYTLFKVCQESFTNAVRHGKAKNINVDIVFKDSNLKLTIKDDGEGCKIIKKGFGLRGIEERVKELNGEARFFTNCDNGFKIELELPL